MLGLVVAISGLVSSLADEAMAGEAARSPYEARPLPLGPETTLEQVHKRQLEQVTTTVTFSLQMVCLLYVLCVISQEFLKDRKTEPYHHLLYA